MKRASLAGADLTGALLYGADLSGANLEGASCRSAYGSMRGLLHAVLRGADVSLSTMADAEMADSVNLSHATIKQSNLNGVNSAACDLSSAVA